MIFQDPYASLNPRMTVFDALAEAIQAHRRVASSELPARVGDLMKKVGLLPATSKSIRTNSRADNASASPSPARSPSSRN